MKKIISIMFTSFCIVALGNASPTFVHKSKGIQLSGVENMTTTVPSDVLQRFFDSFVYDDAGKFRGAYTGEIEGYATMPEIISIVIGTGVQTAGINIYEGYKPKLRGCKQNDKWICTVEGDVVDIP